MTAPRQNLVATTMTNHAQQSIISSLILILNQIHPGSSLLLIFGGSKHIYRTALLIIILTGSLLCNAIALCLETCDHEWTRMGNDNYNPEELQRRRWFFIPYWVFHLTLNVLFYLLYDFISILYKDIENIWTTCRTIRRIHLSPWTIARSVGLQILPLSSKGLLKRQQKFLMMLSTTSTVLLLMRQVECDTFFCPVGLFQSDSGGHLLMDVGLST